jgi:hypothetical protein
MRIVAMRGDEARVVAAFERYLRDAGWRVSREVEFCDLVAERDGERLFVEAKGRTAAIGTDVDAMYGQILRRMPLAEDPTARFAVVVPTRAENAALRVPSRVRALLGVEVFVVDDADVVAGPK